MTNIIKKLMKRSFIPEDFFSVDSTMKVAKSDPGKTSDPGTAIMKKVNRIYDKTTDLLEKGAEAFDKKVGIAQPNDPIHRALSKHGKINRIPNPKRGVYDIHNNISSRNIAGDFVEATVGNLKNSPVGQQVANVSEKVGTKAKDIGTAVKDKASTVKDKAYTPIKEYLEQGNMSPQNFIKSYENNIEAIAKERGVKDFDVKSFLTKGDTYEGLDAGMQAMRKEVLEGIDSEKLFTKRGMEGMLENFDGTGNLYSGFNKAGETTGSPLVNLLSGTTDHTGKNVAGLLGTAALAGGVNSMMGGDFGEGALAGGLAAFSARGISQAYMRNMGGMEESFMKRTIGKAGSESPGKYKFSKGLDSEDVKRGIPRKMNLSQIKHIANNKGLSSGVQKEAKAFIERKGPNRVMEHNRSMTIGGGMLAGVAFTGRSDKRDYRRGFNSHRGNRI